ncbi:MAG: PEP/pyruvate-binding domain-containing protein [bacterium]
MSDSGFSVPPLTSPYRRKFDDPESRMTVIGPGEIGGKALGLGFIDSVLNEKFLPEKFPDFHVSIPQVTVLRTGVFELFLKRNSLLDRALSGQLDDAGIAREFQRADFPAEFTGDLMALVQEIHRPLAVRSSSLLEDRLVSPFAGVYGTKMIPNDSHDPSERFRRLIEAIKYVWASTYFSKARDYQHRTGTDPRDERMAVIVQEVVGESHNGRFYPNISGVARSFAWYPIGNAKPELGVVNLALGLGKTIVDGGLCWIYSPARPKVGPPVGSTRERIETTQTRFWSVRMGCPPVWNPIKEDEFLVQAELQDAESDDVLAPLASVYDPESDRLQPGISRIGPRVLDFAPILQHNINPLNDLLKELMSLGQEAMEAPVEIEFAAVFSKNKPSRFAVLQIRPMAAPGKEITVTDDEMKSSLSLVSSDQVLGNGVLSDLYDILHVRSDTFDAGKTRLIADELGEMNRMLLTLGRPYVLIGFGRWGSSDPWLGIPVVWSQISGARAIVEVSGDQIVADVSQGSHFFHNLSAFGVCYLSLRHGSRYHVDWDWLARQKAVREGNWVRHIRLASPLTVRLDGRRMRGVILHG